MKFPSFFVVMNLTYTQGLLKKLFTFCLRIGNDADTEIESLLWNAIAAFCGYFI